MKNFVTVDLVRAWLGGWQRRRFWSRLVGGLQGDLISYGYIWKRGREVRKAFNHGLYFMHWGEMVSIMK